MLIEFVQDDFFDMRIGIKSKGKKAGLPEGCALQFNSSVRTKSGKEKISVTSNEIDVDGKVFLQKDLSEIDISPGNYRFEINLILENGKKKTIIPKTRGKMIVLPKEGAEDED